LFLLIICAEWLTFVEKLGMSELGFERAEAAETGRPGYDPRDLLKLYLYGYLNQIRSSRRLEAECRRIGIATMAYNLKRMSNVLGAAKLARAFYQG
jgi:hypothetical protein